MIHINEFHYTIVDIKSENASRLDLETYVELTHSFFGILQ